MDKEGRRIGLIITFENSSSEITSFFCMRSFTSVKVSFSRTTRKKGSPKFCTWVRISTSTVYIITKWCKYSYIKSWSIFREMHKERDNISSRIMPAVLGKRNSYTEAKGFRTIYHMILWCIAREMVNMNQTILRTKLFLLFRNLPQSREPSIVSELLP